MSQPVAEAALAATRGDVDGARELLGDDDPYQFFVWYFSRHPVGSQKGVLTYLSLLPPYHRVRILQKQNELDSTNLAVYDKLALALLKSGQTIDALRFLNEALERGSIAIDAHLTLTHKLALLQQSRKRGFGSSIDLSESLVKIRQWRQKPDTEDEHSEFVNLLEVFCQLADE